MARPNPLHLNIMLRSRELLANEIQRARDWPLTVVANWSTGLKKCLVPPSLTYRVIALLKSLRSSMADEPYRSGNFFDGLRWNVPVTGR